MAAIDLEEKEVSTWPSSLKEGGESLLLLRVSEVKVCLARPEAWSLHTAYSLGPSPPQQE